VWLCLSDSNITNKMLDSSFLSRTTIVVTRRGRLDSWQLPHPSVSGSLQSQKLAIKQVLTHRPYMSCLGAGDIMLGRGPQCVPANVVHGARWKRGRGLVLAIHNLLASSLRQSGTYLCSPICPHGVDRDSCTLLRVQQRILRDCDKVQ